mmetsp:Transcript_54888/g.139114  ORF Transcript_54888/g.139114 Transcript_54888/m.139114 type:complete len:103 (+) Transcript_54888:103-411(+)
MRFIAFPEHDPFRTKTHNEVCTEPLLLSHSIRWNNKGSASFGHDPPRRSPDHVEQLGYEQQKWLKAHISPLLSCDSCDACPSALLYKHFAATAATQLPPTPE